MNANKQLIKSMVDAHRFIDFNNQKHNNIQIVSAGKKLAILSTNGYILYIAEFDFKLRPFKIKLPALVVKKNLNIFKEATELAFYSDHISLLNAGAETLNIQTEYVEYPYNYRIFFENPPACVFNTKAKSLLQIKKYLDKGKELLPLYITVNNDKVMLHNDNVSIIPEHTDVTGSGSVKIDAKKLYKILMHASMKGNIKIELYINKFGDYEHNYLYLKSNYVSTLLASIR